MLDLFSRHPRIVVERERGCRGRDQRPCRISGSKLQTPERILKRPLSGGIPQITRFCVYPPPRSPLADPSGCSPTLELWLSQVIAHLLNWKWTPTKNHSSPTPQPSRWPSQVLPSWARSLIAFYTLNPWTEHPFRQNMSGIVSYPPQRLQSFRRLFRCFFVNTL